VFLSLSATFDVLSTSALASYHSPMLTCPFYSKEAITQALLWTWSWWSFKSEASNCTRRTLSALLRRFLLFVFCFFRVLLCAHLAGCEIFDSFFCFGGPRFKVLPTE
jgi:hypothetical protein